MKKFCTYVCLSMDPSVQPQACQMALRAEWRVLRANLRGLRGLRASQRDLRASWRGLRASWRSLRATQQGLRASQRGWRASQGGGMDRCMYTRTEFLPILQDFVSSWGRCPKKQIKYLSSLFNSRCYRAFKLNLFWHEIRTK